MSLLSSRFFHSCLELDFRSLPYNVLRDGPRIQEVAPAVSIATLRSALQGRRPLLKHKEPRGLDQHKQPSIHTLLHTNTFSHTNAQGHKNYIQIAKCFPCFRKTFSVILTEIQSKSLDHSEVCSSFKLKDHFSVFHDWGYRLINQLVLQRHQSIIGPAATIWWNFGWQHLC